MRRHTKVYMFSHRSLDLKEVRHFRSKVLGFGAVAGLGIMAALLVLNHAGGDILGLGIDRMSMLTAENRILKDQIRQLGDKIAGVQKSLEKLSDRGNELRTAVDLTKIDDDTRAAAIGGAVPPAVNAFLSGEAREVLSGVLLAPGQAGAGGKAAADELRGDHRRMEYNKGLFSHIPAIKPMAGPYSLNSFGMRIHPVLHVYKMHEGIDIISDVGTNVYAAGDGVVHFSGRTAGDTAWWSKSTTDTATRPSMPISRGRSSGKGSPCTGGNSSQRAGVRDL